MTLDVDLRVCSIPFHFRLLLFLVGLPPEVCIAEDVWPADP